MCSLIANSRALISATMEWEKCVEVEDQMSLIENQFSKQLKFDDASPQDEAAALSFDSLQRDIAGNIRESYQETFVTAREVGKNKIEFLDSLKLAC